MIKQSFIRVGVLFTASFCLLLSACSWFGPSIPGPAWSELLGRLTNTVAMARLDTLPSGIITSYDPAGSNDDFNHYLRKGPPGWIVLADLKGPGYVSRFWFTGADNGKHRLRFFFDGEKNARLDISLGEFCGGAEPFMPPLAVYENYCWFNYLPIPYGKRLVIMAEEGATREGGWPRIFYQVNYSTFPKGTKIESFRRELTAAEQAQLKDVRAAWAKGGIAAAPASAQIAESDLTVAPGEKKSCDAIAGPGMVRRLEITPDFTAVASPGAREGLLRDLVLKISWNGSSDASVEVPLGDFFGSIWRRQRYESAYFGMSGDTFVCGFPMPFEESAAVSVEHQGSGAPVNVKVKAFIEPMATWDPAWGYFHAAWSRSNPDELGRFHTILHAKGKGRYAGCLLGVTTLDRSWWMLEGDEKMYIDGESLPSWHGTGLEDYFNGGWYYQNVLPRPLHGLAFKAFFRVVQYRLHLLDPVTFQTSFDMLFERGPDNNSHGWMESVAYYYMDRPAAAGVRLAARSQREPPKDPLADASIMTELLNAERLGDYRGARDYIDQFLEGRAEFPLMPMLRLRQLAYDERLEGFDAVRPRYEAFMAAETNAAAVEQAKLLLWLHEKPSNALLSLYSNARARAWLDGKEICVTERPEKTVVRPVELAPGHHVLAVEAGWQSYPSWVQVAVRGTDGVYGTEPDWKYKFNPADGFGGAGYDDSSWPEIGGTGVKGPPEEPYVWLEPNAFVDMQSKALGLRPGDSEWPNRGSRVVFRKEFDWPAAR